MARTKQTARKTPEQLPAMDEERKRVYPQLTAAKQKRKRKTAAKLKNVKKAKQQAKEKILSFFFPLSFNFYNIFIE